MGSQNDIPKSFNIGEVLLNAFDRTPNHVSQIDAATGDKTTHAEMKNRSIRCALWMEKQGLLHDEVVALFTPSQLDAYVPVFATYLVQAVMSPWRWDLTLDQTRRWLELFEPRLIFVRVEAVEVVEEALLLAKLSAKIIVFGEHPRHPSLNEILLEQSSIDVENYPDALLRNALDPELQLKGKNVLWYGAPGGIMCNSLMISAVLQNATRIISTVMGPREVCEVIERFKVNYAQVSPAVLNTLARFEDIDKYNMDCLEVMRTSGTKLNRVTFDKLKSSCLREKLFQGYGTTETGATSLHPKYDRSLNIHNSIGFVSSNLQLKIIDRLMKKSLGANSIGEIWIKTPSMMLGYYKNPELTKKVLDADSWYHSGDLGYHDETGEIFFIGRITDAFEYRDREYFTTEIEDVLWEHPAVVNLTVVPVPRESVGQVPIAFVVIEPGKNVTEDEIIKLLKTSDKHKALPLKVQFIDKMPLTPSLKVAKGYLKELALKSTNGYN